jgi:CO/xanthine dehydrogenase Mo-binding subunit
MGTENVISPQRERAAGDASDGVGRNVNKVDARDKLTGAALFGSDLDPDGLLHGAVLRSTRPHARILSVDPSSAEALDGVRCAVPRSEFLGLFDDRVRHYGDAIAAVCAEDEATARRALREIEYELEPLASVHDARQAVRGEGPTVHENNPDLKQDARHPFTVENESYTSNIDDYHRHEHGDVDTALAAADVVLQETYRTPRVNHCNLETHCCVAEWREGTLTLTETLASLGRNQQMLAEFMGLDPDQVDIEMPPTLSSSFGGRSLPKLTLEPVAATLARETGRPVKVWFDREEAFTATSTRHETHYDVTMGVNEDGEIAALDLSIVADTGGYPNGVGHIVLTNSGDRPPELYELPNYRYEGVSVFTNNVPGGEYRGIGSTQTIFVIETHVDELVRRADLDPFAFKRRNFVRELEPRPGLDVTAGPSGVMECLERGRDRFREVATGPTGRPDRLYGRGFAGGAHTTGSGAIDEPDTSEVELVLGEDGAVHATTASGDHGQGSDTVMAQIISQETGIPTADIELRRFGTTEGLEDDLGSVASRSTYIIGGAVRDAARKLASDLERRGGVAFGCEADAVDLAGGTLTGPDGESRTVDEVLAATGGQVTVGGRHESRLNPPSHGVHFAEVEVDAATGEVDVLTYVAAQDVGFAINPKMVEGQLEGALQHGIEFALYSELRLEDGMPENANLADYPVVSPYELPRKTVCEIVESNEESGPYGAKGIGTPSMPPIAPAILNAVRDATGYRCTAPPLSSEATFTHLEESQ